jgi:hypothetical protein
MSYCNKHQKKYHDFCVECALDTTYGAGATDCFYPPGSRNVSDMVNSPDHYTKGDIECIEAIQEAVKDLKGIEAVCTANAIKYLWRWKHKNGVEDLKKAVWYIQRIINGTDID